jgi:hypothetical protein
VSVIFVAFATVWSSSLSTRDNFASQPSSNRYSWHAAPELRFRQWRGDTTTADSFDGDIELRRTQPMHNSGLSNSGAKHTGYETPVQVMGDWEREVVSR